MPHLTAEQALDAEIATAQQETARLHSVITQVQQFEQRKAQLQQRVTLIEQLRREQIGPVHMLDQISRALPPMLWLTEVKQSKGTELQIDGRCTALTSLSDFVSNLERSGYFKKSIVPVRDQNGVELLKHDELMRPQTTMQTLAALEPASARERDHGRVVGTHRLAGQEPAHTAGLASGHEVGA